MRVRVLGPLEVADGDQPVAIGGPKERRLLAALAIRAPEVVSESRLIDVLWGDNPPRTATKTLQNYVLRLRKALHRESGDSGLAIVTVPPGYLLQAGPDEVDATSVTALLAAAREAARDGDHRRALSRLEEALASWRGPSLVEFADEPFAMADAARLDELRQVAIEERVEAQLALGLHGECVGELEALLTENPFRERRWGQLMVALYRSGRQADALRAYQRARRALVEEGLAPGPHLRRLEQAIIDEDPSLDVVAVPPPAPAVGPAPGTGAASAPPPPPGGPTRLPPGAVPPPNAVFVGRTAMLDRLAAAWGRAGQGQRQLVVIRGEAGIGKTSLARAVAARAAAGGGTVLFGRCDEEVGLPYQPFAEAIRAYAAGCPPDELAAQMGPLAGELVRLVPELRERVPGLSEPVTAEPAVERYRLFEAVVALFGGMSARMPVMLLLDDLHWAAKSTLLLLRHVVRSPAPIRVLIVATCRDAGPEVGPELMQVLSELRREPGVEMLDLPGLDPAETVEMLAAQSGQDLGDEDVAFIHTLNAETGGNPLFMYQILIHLVETGAIYREDGRWRTDYRLEDIDLPEGVRGVVRERLGRLSPEANRALAVAAVAGGVVSLDLLERIPDASGSADELLDALDEAVRSNIVVEVPHSPGRYTFAHAVIRQVVCQELTAARRARLHLRVGEAYEALPAVETNLGALAHHFAEAGERDRATRYALAAGRQAVGKLAFEAAVEHLERGVRVLDTVPDPDRSRRADLLLALADARRMVADVAGAQDAAGRAAEDARAIGSPAHLAGAAMLQAGLGVAGRPDPAVGLLCEEALAGLGTGPETAALRVQVLARLALHRALWEGQGPRGGELADQALALARQIDDEDAVHTALFARGLTLAGAPNVAERLELAEELVTGAETVKSRRVLVRGLRLRALARFELGDVAGFTADVNRLEGEARELRDWVSLSETARWRTMLALLEGRFDDVERWSAEMLAQAGADANARNAHLGQLFFLRRDQGRAMEARAFAEDGLRHTPGLVARLAMVALALVETGDEAEARARFNELAAGDFEAVPRDFTWPASLCLLSVVCAALGDAERAGVLSDLYRPHAGHLVVIGWGDASTGAADRYLGMLAVTGGDCDEAMAHFRAAAELEEAAGARPALVRTRTRWADALGMRGAITMPR